MFWWWLWGENLALEDIIVALNRIKYYTLKNESINITTGIIKKKTEFIQNKWHQK